MQHYTNFYAATGVGTLRNADAVSYPFEVE